MQCLLLRGSVQVFVRAPAGETGPAGKTGCIPTVDRIQIEPKVTPKAYSKLSKVSPTKVMPKWFPNQVLTLVVYLNLEDFVAVDRPLRRRSTSFGNRGVN